MDFNAAEQWPDFSDTPYKKRWEPLKPFLEQLYIIERKHVKEVVELMKLRHKFYASENQYKRQFHVWEWTKSLPTAKKTAICKQMQTRAQQGKTSVATYKGQAIDNKQLRRFMKGKARATQQDVMIGPTLGVMGFDIMSLSGHALQCGPRIFMNWNMPYIDLRLSKATPHDPFSPFRYAATPASDVVVATPSSAHMAYSPQNPTSPNVAPSLKNAPSPTVVAVLDAIKIERALLFIQGQHGELLRGMNHQEKAVMTNWMNQFWLFSFKTVKNWGKGPRSWTASMLGFEDVRLPQGPNSEQFSLLDFDPSSPRGFRNQWRTPHTGDGNSPRVPSSQCRWSIHIRNEGYKRIASPPRAESDTVNYEDEESWQAWTEPQSTGDCAQVLKTNLATNDFSSIQMDDLPVSAFQISKATEKSPEEILQETFGFAIMSHNTDMVEDLVHGERLDNEVIARGGLYPFHLAISYLDGSKTCCNLFNCLVDGMPTGEASIRKLYINHLGHTVLDNLMINILKSHTSCSPGLVDDSFKKEQRFVGEDVDICGRWDADSECIQDLNRSHGNSPIPFQWKHMFCHTSVQAICHCIGSLFGPHWGPDINSPSGLFTRRCLNESCGLKLQLLPLHTLVVTTVHLATQGSSGETLFGMVACLLCLLSFGANPLLKAQISLKALLSDESDENECSHQELSPIELIAKVPDDTVSSWPRDAKMGWELFCRVLELSHRCWGPETKGRKPSFDLSQFLEVPLSPSLDEVDIDEMDVDEMEIDRVDGHDREESCKECHRRRTIRNTRQLSQLWASVQTEFTTYRQTEECDAWISPNFNIHSIIRGIDSGEDLDSYIGLIHNRMMSEAYCDCGRFYNATDYVCVRSEEVSTYHFSNLEDWKRTTFVNTDGYRIDEWID